MLNFLNSLPLNGYKTYVGIGAYIVVTLLVQFGLLDPAIATLLMPYIQGWIGVAVAHKIDKMIAGFAAAPLAPNAA